MKKRIISLTLAVMMIAATLIGCGGNDTTKNETPVTPNTEVTTETPTPETETPDVDVPETEVSDSEVDVENFFKDAYSLEFPTGLTGFTDKYVFSSDETWSLNDTHYVDANGNVMDFEWEGPTVLGESAGDNDNSLNLQGGNYELFAWTYGYADGDYELCLDIDKDTWTTYTISNVAYVENGYYNVDTTDTTIRVIFEVEGAGYKGYTSCITDSVNKICYQFAYLEKIENYDANRAMKVIESIKFWDYEKTNE